MSIQAVIGVFLALLLILGLWLWRHQRLLSMRAHLMSEALRNLGRGGIMGKTDTCAHP